MATTNGSDRWQVAISNASTQAAENAMTTGTINDQYNVNDFLTYLLKKSFLENGEPSTVFMRFWTKASHQGYKSITWPRLGVMKTSLADAALVEWVTPDGHANVVKTVTAVPVQLGDYSIISDVLDVETLLPIIAAQGRELANNAWRLIDEYIQDTLLNSTIWSMYAGTATSRATLTAADVMDLDLVLKACTFLAAQGQTGERFKIIMHPNVFLDYAKSSSTNTWLNKLIYEDFKGIKDGFVTAWVNYDIYISSNVKPIEVDPDDPADEDGDEFLVYPSYAFRDGAYGVWTLQNLETFYKPFWAAGTEDPLNQRATVGWKCMYGCAVLNDLFIVRMESRAGTNYAWQENLS